MGSDMRCFFCFALSCVAFALLARRSQWGMFSMVAILLDALSTVLAKALPFDFFIQLSDADLALRTDGEARQRLERTGRTDGRTDGRTENGRTDGRTENGRTDGRTDGRTELRPNHRAHGSCVVLYSRANRCDASSHGTRGAPLSTFTARGSNRRLLLTIAASRY